MTLLLGFLLLFGIIHINPAVPKWKAHAIATFGKAYGAIYGVLTFMLFAGLLWAYRQTDPSLLFQPPQWGRYASFGLTLVGFLSLGIFIFRGSWRNQLRYPMALAVIFWASAHLLANGQLRAVLFFGGLAVIAIVFALLKNVSSQFSPTEARQGHNALSLLGGIALYGIAAQLHAVIAGVPLVVLQ
jgi:uncharacterized membrane protein